MRFEFGLAAGVDLFLDVPDLAAFDGLVGDLLRLLGSELGLVAGAFGGVAPLLHGHGALLVADVFGHD